MLLYTHQVKQSFFIGLVSLLNDEGDSDDDGYGSDGTDDVDLFSVAEHADQEPHDDGREGKSGDDSHVFGEDQSADVTQLAYCHRNAGQKDALEEMFHIHFQVSVFSLRDRVQNGSRVENQNPLNKVDMNRMHSHQLLGQHHSIPVNHHKHDHANPSNGHNHRILRLIALKLTLIDIVILIDVTNQVRAIRSNCHSKYRNYQKHYLGPINGHPIEIVVVDVDEDGRDAVESNRNGKGQVKLGEGVAEVVKYHYGIPCDQPLVVVAGLEDEVQFQVASHGKANDGHCNAPNNACLNRMELMLVAIDITT